MMGEEQKRRSDRRLISLIKDFSRAFVSNRIRASCAGYLATCMVDNLYPVVLKVEKSPIFSEPPKQIFKIVFPQLSARL
jgi:hypothetical protein